MRFKFFYIALASVLFSGCATINISSALKPVSPTSNVQSTDYGLDSVNVVFGLKHERTGDVDYENNALLESYKLALNKHMDNLISFNERSNKKIQIEAKIIKNDWPAFGASLTVLMDVTYKVTNQSGELLYSKTISSEGVALMGEEFVAVKRVLLACERASSKNIEQFTDDLKNSLSTSSTTKNGTPASNKGSSQWR